MDLMPCQCFAAADRRSSSRPLVQEPMKTRSSAMSSTVRARLQVPCTPAPQHRAPLRRIARLSGSGMLAPIADRHPGICAPGHDRLQPRAVDLHFAVEARTVIRCQAAATALTASTHAFPLRRVRTSLQVGKRCLIRSDHAGAGAAFDAHVAQGHALFHGEAANRFARILDDIARATVGAEPAMMCRIRSLTKFASASSRNRDPHAARLGLRHALGRQHVLNF